MGNSLFQKVISSSMLRVLYTILSALVAYFMLPFLAHNLGARDYGLWIVVVTIIGYYGMLDLGIASAVGRFVGRSYGRNDFNDINQVISTSVFSFLIFGTIIFLIAAGGSFSTSVFMDSAQDAELVCYIIIILSAAISTQFPLRAVNGIVYASVSHHLIVLAESIKLVLKTVLTVYTVLSGYGILMLALTFAVAELIGNIIQYMLITSKFPQMQISSRYISASKLKSILSYGWVAFIARLMVVLKLRLIPILVSSLISIEFVVVYMVAVRLMDYIHQLTSTITGIFGPIFSRLEIDKEKLKTTYYRASYIIAFVALYIGSSVAFYSKWLIPVWMGEGYDVSYSLTFILCVPFTFISIQLISREILFGLSKHKYCAIIDTLEVAFIILCSMVLTKFYGIYGIAIGFAIATVFGELFYPFIVSKNVGLNPLHVYFNTIILPIIKLIPLLVIFFMFASRYMESSYLSLIKWNLIQMLIFIPIGYFFLPKDIRKKLNIKMKGIFLTLNVAIVRR